jgi:seryl-tRNA synthetase
MDDTRDKYFIEPKRTELNREIQRLQKKADVISAQIKIAITQNHGNVGNNLQALLDETNEAITQKLEELEQLKVSKKITQNCGRNV